MRPTDTEPERWSDRETGVAMEDVVGATLRRAREATAPSARTLAHLAALSPSMPVPSRRRGALKVALAAGALLSFAGTVGAARGPLRAWLAEVFHGRSSLTAAPALPVKRATVKTQRAPTTSSEVAPPPEASSSPSVDSTAFVAPAATPTQRRSRRGPASTGIGRSAIVGSAIVRPAPADQALPTSAPSVPDPRAEEAGLMARAFRALRTDHDPSAALALLAERESRFAGGHLGEEARVARVEALMALGRSREALAALDGVERVALPRSLKLARAELRSVAGRCAEATADFDAVLDGDVGDALGERALYARASCRLARGDMAGARSDLTRLVTLHGDGPLAADARRALERLDRTTP